MPKLLPLLVALLLATLAPARAANTFDVQRITSTAATPSVPLGSPVTIGWSIVPDGLALPSFGTPSGSSPTSNLIARFDTVYNVPAAQRTADLTTRPWRQDMQLMLDRFASKSGLSYVYKTDDGADWGANGSADRGDVRIAGTTLVNLLGYNNSPSGGSDMVLHTAGNGFSNPNTLRLIFTHEHAHGLGLGHGTVAGNCALSVVCAAGGNTNGPQFDDLLALHRKHGDALEENGGNNTRANATPLGALPDGGMLEIGVDAGALAIAAAETDFVSVDDDSDADWFSFALTSQQSIALRLEPRGPTYSYDPDGRAAFTINAGARSDLKMQLFAANGALLKEADATGSGAAEVIAGHPLAAGSYTVEVTGKANAAQFYHLSITAAALDFEFATAGDTEGWTGQNTTAPTAASDTLIASATSGDPQLRRPDLNLDGDAITGVYLRLKSSVAGDVQLFWGINGGGFAAAQSAIVTYDSANTYQEIFFDLTDDPDWAGRNVTSLRLDPPGVSGTNYELDWVRLTGIDRDGDGTSDRSEITTGRDPFSAADLASLFDTFGDFEGWVPSNINVPSVSGGSAGGSAMTADPQLVKADYSFDADAVSGLLVRAQTSITSTLQVFWGIPSADNFIGDRSLGTTLPGDNQFHTLHLPLSESAEWVGQTITRLRIDPINKAGRIFNIDSIQATDGDFDDDTIPDSWEAANALDALDPSDAALDPDGDGQSNLAEYQAGTDPQDAGDRLQITALSQSPLTLHIDGKASRAYQLERSTDGETWAPTDTTAPLAADTALTLSDTEAPSGTALYRVRVIAP